MKKPCPDCKGTGKANEVEYCDTCEGQGYSFIVLIPTDDTENYREAHDLYDNATDIIN